MTGLPPLPAIGGDIVTAAQARYSTKAYDSTRRLSDDNIAAIKALLRYSPSSVNSQPWHFILASSDQGIERIAQSTREKYDFNTAKILDASHVVVVASKTDWTENDYQRLLDLEEDAGRFAADPQGLRERQNGGLRMFIEANRQAGRLEDWLARQTYLNLGQFLLGVAALGIDATPMEGVDTDILDREFGLAEKGYHALAVVTLGYRTGEDFNAKLNKARFAEADIITEV